MRKIILKYGGIINYISYLNYNDEYFKFLKKI